MKTGGYNPPGGLDKSLLVYKLVVHIISLMCIKFTEFVRLYPQYYTTTNRTVL